MKNNLIKTAIISLILTIGMFFINIDGVHAAVKTKACYYEWSDVFSSATGEATTVPNYKYGYIIKQSNGKIDIETSFGCSLQASTNRSCIDNNNFKSKLKNLYSVRYRTWLNTNHVKESSKNAQSFISETACVPRIWIDYEGYYPSEDAKKVNISLEQNGCRDCNKEKPKTKEELNKKLNTSDVWTDGTNLDDSTRVDASDDIKDIENWGNKAKTEVPDEGDYSNQCEIIDPEIITFLTNLFIIIQVIGILLLIILTAADFIKVITGSDDDNLPKAFKRLLKRIIIVVIILLLPLLIKWVLNMVNTVHIDKMVKSNDGYEIQGQFVIGDDGEPICRVGNK